MIVTSRPHALICQEGLTKPQKVLLKLPNGVTEISIYAYRFAATEHLSVTRI